jgi:hypothetical protein
MADRGRNVDALVSGLSGMDRENAWHSLAELGPGIAPDIIAILQTIAEPTVAIALIRLLAEYRSPEAIPILAGRLRDPERDVWQAALDALVTIGTVQSAEALTAAVTTMPEDRKAWISEALEQVRGGALGEVLGRGASRIISGAPNRGSLYRILQKLKDPWGSRGRLLRLGNPVCATSQGGLGRGCFQFLTPRSERRLRRPTLSLPRRDLRHQSHGWQRYDWDRNGGHRGWSSAVGSAGVPDVGRSFAARRPSAADRRLSVSEHGGSEPTEDGVTQTEVLASQSKESASPAPAPAGPVDRTESRPTGLFRRHRIQVSWKTMRHPLFPAFLIALAWALRPACGLAEPAPPAKPAAPPRGVLVEKVACAGQPEQSYALYPPSGYTLDRRWPVLYAFDARGDGKRVAELFQAAAEAHGWIVVSSWSSASDGPGLPERASRAGRPRPPR